MPIKKCFLIIVPLLILSCNHKKLPNAEHLNDTIRTTKVSDDSLYGKKIVPNSKNVVMPDGSAPTASLPFGPAIKSISEFYKSRDNSFYMDIIGKDFDKEPKYTKTFRLPKPGKVDYVVIDENETQYIPCAEAMNYKVRLPDIGALQVYYMSNSRNNGNDFGADFQKKCSNDLPEYFGYLILYDILKNQMKVLLIYMENYVDSFISRTFYIDSSYKVHVSEDSYTDGENDHAEKYADWIYEINLSDKKLIKKKIK